MFFGKKKLVGLDIGSSSIKLAELNVARNKTSLVGFTMISTPPGSVTGGEVVDPQAVSSTIKQLVKEAKTSRQLASTGLWGTSVIVKRISIPRMEENLVSEQIRWEAEQYIPYDVNEVNLEFKVLSSSSSAETMDVLLVAAVQDSIYRCAEVVNMSGLQCEVLDVEGFALANCFEKNYGEMADQSVGLLNIGAEASNFVVVQQGEVVFCRDIPIGGNAYTDEIQKALNLSWEEAESIKISACTGQAAPEEANEIIKTTHEVVSEEVAGSVDFFQNTSSSGPLQNLFVTGGAIKTPGLFDSLSNRYSCERMDPFLSIKVNTNKFSSQYFDQIRDFASLAVGLGMRGPGES